MAKIHTIHTTDLDNDKKGVLGIDDESNLYWNEKLVVTEQKIKLQWWVDIAIILASFSTIILAVFTVLQFFGFGCSE